MEAEEEVEPNISLIPEEFSKEKQTLAIVGKRKRSRTVDNRT